MSDKSPDLDPGEVIDRYEVTRLIAHGGSGAVYEVVQQSLLNMPRALKMLDPDPDSVAKQGREEFEKTFLKEIKLLASVTHRNVVKVIDAGVWVPKEAEEGCRYRYFVMELVPGPGAESVDLAEMFNTSTSADCVIDIILQALEGLLCLHDRGIMHADLKPSNILCQRIDDSVEVRISDLGVSKVLRVSDQDQDDDLLRTRSTTYLHGTDLYMPPYARDRKDKPIPYEDLAEFHPHYDIFSLGVSFAELISQERLRPDQNIARLLDSAKTGIVKALRPEQMMILRDVIQRMTVPSYQDPERYTSVRDVIRDVRKIRDDYLQPLGTPEFAIGGHGATICTSGSHVRLSDRMKRLINHPMVQRLQNQNQLHLLYQVYPGGRGSRFVQSLASYSMVQKYICALVRNPAFRYVMNRADYELACVAALLHNVGYYPLARAFEDLCQPRIGGGGCLGTEPEPQAAMREYFLRLAPHDGEPSVLKLIEQDSWRFETDALLRVLCRGSAGSPAEGIVQSLVDGPMAATKLAYLQEDSRSTGVPFGAGIDLEGVLASLTVIPGPRGGTNRAQIGISPDARVHQESIDVVRCWMYSRVYWHHTNRAMMAMLKHVASAVFKSSDGIAFNEFIRQTVYGSEIDAVRILADAYDKVIGDDRHNPARQLLDGQRKHYRVLLAVSAGDGEYRGRLAMQLIQRQQSNQVETVRKEVLAILKNAVRVGIPDRCAVLLDIPSIDPPSSMYAPVATEPAEPSDMRNLAYEHYQNLAARDRRCTFFVPLEVREDLTKTRMLRAVQDAILKKLDELLK